jgi:hypothetical protein
MILDTTMITLMTALNTAHPVEGIILTLIIGTQVD